MAFEKPYARKKQAEYSINGHLGKLPPQAVDLEESVLGAIMLEKNAILDVIDILTPDAFYKDAHQILYTACQQLYYQNKPVDILTVTHFLRASGQLEYVGGGYYISQLTGRIGSSAHIEFHARVILEKFIEREIIRISGRAIKDAYGEGEVSDVFDQLDAMSFQIQSAQERLLGKTMGEGVAHGAESLYQKIVSEITTGHSAGIPTGFSDLDNLTGGWQPKEMAVLMARPGMGKTSWLIDSVVASCKNNKRSVVFSIEMSSEALIQRMLSNLSGVAHDKIKIRKLHQYELESMAAAKENIKKMPLYICDEARINTQTIKTVLRSQNRLNKTPVDIVFIDYLQMIKSPQGVKFMNRDGEVTEISRDLKAIAKEFNVPVVVISSMNRECEKRADKRPEMSDARDSGSIESDADVILSLYRPSVYWEQPGNNREQHYQQMNPNIYKTITELSVLKQRSGGVGTILQNFRGDIFKFWPYIKDTSEDIPF